MIELKIVWAENGYILDYEEEIEEGVKVIRHAVIEDFDGFEGQQDCMKRMLERVAEHFGYSYDKWSDKNLNISFDRKGHKVEDD